MVGQKPPLEPWGPWELWFRGGSPNTSNLRDSLPQGEVLTSTQDFGTCGPRRGSDGACCKQSLSTKPPDFVMFAS